MSTVHIIPDDLSWFAESCGDLNPLHLDPDYAARSGFGAEVAQGALTVLHALAHLSTEDAMSVRRVRARFHAPVYPGQSYSLDVGSAENGNIRLEISDSGQPVATVDAGLGDTNSAEVGEVRVGSGDRGEEVADRAPAELQAGQRIPVSYRSGPGDFAGLLGHIRSGVREEVARLLGWASYLAGMEVPGRQSLISSLTVEFDPAAAGDGSIRVAAVDERRDMVRFGGALPGLGRVELAVVARAVPSEPDAHALAAALVGGPDVVLTGKVAVLTGGSRGFGAAFAAALALRGAHVYVTHRREPGFPPDLLAGLGTAAERVHAVRSDAADPAECARLREHVLAREGRLDLLVLNAFPSFQPLLPGPDTADRAAEYVTSAVNAVSAPLSALTEPLSVSGGQVVLVSSDVVSGAAPTWQHYVDAKRRCEELLRATLTENPVLGGLVLRPPRLDTGFSPTVRGVVDGLAVEGVAAASVTGLGQVTAGQVEVLESFAPVAEPPAANPEAADVGVLAIAATFTTDPLAEPVAAWCRSLGFGLRPVLAPFGQVFQELLDPASTLGSVRSGCAVVLVRFDDWPVEETERNLRELAAAVRSFTARTRVPLLLRICPSPSVVGADPRQRTLFDDLHDTSGVHLLGAEDWHGGTDPGDVHDEARYRMAHLAYTPAGYDALATGIARSVHALLARPFKVLVLDCDNTLWAGVAGEDGPEGIRLTDGHRRLQEWAVALREQGVLLALASKNDPETVAEVFRARAEFPLRSDHVAAQAIGWDPKPAGLSRLAAELNLGLDSFVFLDDNPVEVAQVRAGCPGVLALTVPAEQEAIKPFLDRVWAFDRLVVTEEDRGRAAAYDANRDRGELRRSSLTFADFIAGLNLVVDITPATDADLRRVAQMTQRTNQFNFSTVRRQENEFRALLAEPGMRCDVVRATDRFGDHGVVGAVISRQNTDELVVDTFLLSCRVLGRGVEHQVLAALGSDTSTKIRLPYVPTAKNEPARRFLDSVADGVPAAGGTDYLLTAERAAEIRFDPESATATADSPAAPVAAMVDAGPRLSTLVALAENSTGARELDEAASAGQRDALEIVIDVLTDVLALPQGALTADSALAGLGASSLALVEAAVTLQTHFGAVELEVFYEHRTVGDLAASLGPVVHRPPSSASGQDEAVEPLVNGLVRGAREALEAFHALDQEQIDQIVAKAARAAAASHLDLAVMAVAETERGVVEDKAVKNLFAAEHVTNSMTGLRTVGEIRRDELTGLVEIAEPVGVVCAITPVTNPTSTVVFKALIALKTRNPIIFAFHHLAPGCGAEAARIVRDAAVAAGAPAHCVQWVDTPRRAITQALMNHDGVSLVLATGGNDVVRAAHSAGKPAIGVGAGNVPAFIAADADLARAAHDIVLSKSFDNGMTCAAEQTLLIDTQVYDQAVDRLRDRHAHVVSLQEKRALEDFLFGPDARRDGKVSTNPAASGRSAHWIADRAGFSVPENTTLLLAEVGDIGPDEPLTREKPCPIVAVLRVAGSREGIRRASDVVEFHGKGHTAVVHTADERLAEDFGNGVKAVRVVWNSPAAQGGIGDLYNAFLPSMTLGCGSYGGNSVSGNVTAANLLNIRRIARRNNNIQWFKVPPKIYFEPDSIRYLGEMAGVHRVSIVTGRTVAKLGYADKVRSVLAGRPGPVAVQLIDFVEPEPSLQTVHRGAEMMREFQPDTIVAIGGGSSLDAGKLMWLWYEHPEVDFAEAKGRFADIRKRLYRFPEPKLAKLVCVPTTSGSGSEVTPFAVVTDRETGRKYPLADYALTPSVAIVDPVLVRSLPAGLAADSGFDALTHATEAYVSVYSNDFTDGLCLQAIKLIFENLEDSVLLGTEKAREAMHNAATIAGMAFGSAFLGIVHAMSHTLGATFGLAHGRTNALLLPHVIRYNGQPPSKLTGWPKYENYQAPERFQHIARTLGLPAATPEQGVSSYAAAVERLRSAVGLPASFAEAGVPQAPFMNSLAQQALNAFDDQCAPANPRQPMLTDMEELMRTAYTNGVVELENMHASAYSRR
ncbi:bifunctional acetaldehyde-CoA/alcohol dehydrogenase [Lentzea flaviverrucosa]|uniref:alcohol dehydrogenase n=1 Tax=Lentzea flaviverrucosa TaxID=200379 RepID=A0A1H9BHE6_9PSEU|nr:bifunctional acetaldehyde-CoA/alcohol dehydrogenase [Lentzea flaviverrucosa]RDI31770.1 HAD superfamily phosphatase (TIGR01681 family)/FkbH-like protein [Lentzea flaviverrucosa]SEP88404.1 HAD-superfamily phosphatase, subfamily IIIC/FkbH-like domain-containing protein [Lentzea flaviverrucosa]